MPTEFDKIAEHLQSVKLPSEPVALSPSVTVTDPAKFVERHIAILKANGGNNLFMPYFIRLKRFYQIVTKTQ